MEFRVDLDKSRRKTIEAEKKLKALQLKYDILMQKATQDSDMILRHLKIIQECQEKNNKLIESHRVIKEKYGEK